MASRYSPWARCAARLLTELTPSKREAIIKQIEFYFGDSNFPKDKYLQKEAKKRADGFVPIKVGRTTSFSLPNAVHASASSYTFLAH